MERSSFFNHLIDTGQFVITEDGHAMLLGEFVILTPSAILLKLYETLEKKLGSRQAQGIIISLGEFQMEAALKRYKKRFEIGKVQKEKIIDFLFKILNILGWGGGEINKLSFEEKYAEIIMTNSTLAKKYFILYGKKSREPVDFYIVGWLKKLFESVFGTKIRVVEKKCAAKGDKFCEFIISTNGKKS